MASGVATRPVADLEAYKQQLNTSVYRSAFIMRRVFEVARTDDRRIVFAEGEDERVLHAVQAMTEEVTARPILIGRPDVIESRCERNAIPLKVGRDFELVNPEDDPRYREYWGTYHAIMQRRGVTPDLARAIMRTNTTAIAAIMVHRGEADSMICGTFGQYLWHLKYVQRGARQRRAAPDRGAVADDPRAGRDLRRRHPGAPGADAAGDRRRDDRRGAARAPLRAGAEDRALLALAVRQPRHRLGRRMRAALAILDAQALDFDYEGEMHSDAALDPELRARIFPNARFEGPANVLIFANTDAASAVRNVTKMLAGGLEVGPILMGMGNRAHIVTPSITARGLLNIAALAGAPVQSYG